MSHPRYLLILLFISGLLFPTAIQAADRETIYQVSTIDALLTGLYDGFATVKTLRAHGDFGIGTFNALDGEMVIVDGTCYQITADGKARAVKDDATTPFAAVTFFDADKTLPATAETAGDFAKLTALIDTMLPSKNLFYAVRLDGTFSLVKARSVPKQQQPYPKLTDVTAKQPVFTLTDVKGTIVGYRCPSFVKGLNVPGYHLHFISADRTAGGHILDCKVTSATISVDVTPGFQLVLPETGGFLALNFEQDRAAELEKAEKEKK